jgi:hypothetical protein
MINAPALLVKPTARIRVITSPHAEPLFLRVFLLLDSALNEARAQNREATGLQVRKRKEARHIPQRSSVSPGTGEAFITVALQLLAFNPAYRAMQNVTGGEAVETHKM